MRKATGAKKPSESQKAKALWTPGEEYYDPARKEDILGQRQKGRVFMIRLAKMTLLERTKTPFANFDTDAPNNSSAVFSNVQISAPIDSPAAAEFVIFAAAHDIISILPHSREHLLRPLLVQLAAQLA